MSNRYGNAPAISTSRDVRTARLKTADGSTAFEEGRAFRLPFEYGFDGTPVVLRFTAPVGFKLTEQLLSCDVGNVRLAAYRDGIESGVWTNVPSFSKNPAGGIEYGYTGQVIIATGGAFDPNGNPSVDVLRVRTAGSTAQRSTASKVLASDRALPAGVYYIVLSRIDGTGASAGVYLIEWEEDTV